MDANGIFDSFLGATDNIAIIILMICLVFSGAFNVVLLNGLLKMKDVLTQLAMSIAELNGRLDHDDK